MKGRVRRREVYKTRPWRGFINNYYRDFWTQAEAFEWTEKKVYLYRKGLWP